MNKELLYDLEYKVNELRNQCLNYVRYAEVLTLKEVLDLGFNDTYIFNETLEQYVSLGYKEIGENGAYYSSDLGYLTEEQLKCNVKYKYHELNDDNYIDITLELVNKENEELFIKKEC